MMEETGLETEAHEAVEEVAQRKLHKIIRALTDEAREMEESVLENSWLSMKKKADASSYLYHATLNKMVGHLRNISLHLFYNVETRSVRVYGADEVLPDEFQQYFFASQHLTNAITEDILSAPSLATACMRIERWVALLKLTHEGQDYFSANIIMLALASQPVAKSGLETLLTKTAKAVLAYCQKKYIDHSFMFNLQAHRLMLDEVFIPFLPTITKGVNFIKEGIKNCAFSRRQKKRLIKRKQEPYYQQLARLKEKLPDYQLTHQEAKVIRELKKEPLLSFDILFQSRSADWAYRKKSEWLKVSLTMASLKAFERSDRFYLAKQAIEDEINALQALGGIGESAHMRVLTIIRNTEERESSKYKALRRYYRSHAKGMNKSVKHILMNIIRSYADILYYSEKSKNLEPRFKKSEWLERGESVSSELSGEIREPVDGFHKKFSFIHQKEKELGLKADSPVLQRRMTPRSSLGYFEGRKSRQERRDKSRRLERAMSL